MPKYVKVVSWHEIRYETGGIFKTLCGLFAGPDRGTAIELPDGRSCESCFRKGRRNEEKR